MNDPLSNTLRKLIQQRDDAIDLLRELYAVVRGECPRLFNEDSGGNAELEMRIIDVIAKAKAQGKQP